MNFSSIQVFFTAFESWAPGVVQHYSKSKQKANLAICTENLNAKLKNLIQILAYRGIALAGFEQPGTGAPLLGLIKLIN